MNLAALFFYLFAAVAVGSAFMVIASRNPVHSVLFLILTFVNAGGLFILIGAEFLGLALIFVYVGAVATLFLFVVMMLDVDFVELRQGFLQYLPAGVIIGLIFLIELLLVAGTWVAGSGISNAVRAPIPPASQVTNTQAIGRVLYTDYVHYFELSGVVLLVAMIGAIVLTLQHRKNVHRQNIAAQNARSKKTALEIKKVQPGQGI